MVSDFHTEVAKLRLWRATNRWVDQYDYWWSEGGVVTSLEQFLARVDPHDWTEDDITDLLYLLEESSTSWIAELLTASEPMALIIARHSLDRGGDGAYDLVTQLRHCVQYRDEAEALLIAFARDEFEGTRRSALLSLATMQSWAVPGIAVEAWNTNDESSSIGALSALRTVASPLFPVYLAKAKEDVSTAPCCGSAKL
jgi:hypothetical protein